MENDILKQAVLIMNAPNYSVSAMCEALQISRSTYYYEAKQSREDSELTKAIVEIFRTSRNHYGTCKIKKELAVQNILASRCIIERIMKQEGGGGADEYLDIVGSQKLNLVLGQFEAKQFGFNAEETLKFANWAKDSVAVIEVIIPHSLLNEIGDFTLVDVGIFRSGNVTITQPGLDKVNAQHLGIWEKY